jgi:hypothetical protein
LFIFLPPTIGENILFWSQFRQKSVLQFHNLEPTFLFMNFEFIPLI